MRSVLEGTQEVHGDQLGGSCQSLGQPWTLGEGGGTSEG